MSHTSEYDFLFKVLGQPLPSPRGSLLLCQLVSRSSRPAAPPDASPPLPASVQLLLIGDSGVGKSCLLLRFAVRPRPRAACAAACLCPALRLHSSAPGGAHAD